MIDGLTDPQVWAGFFTLTALEIVLGVDNLVFVAILASRLPRESQQRARQLGLGLALISRLALLVSITWIIGLTRPLFEVFGHAVSWRDIVLAAGGLFLLYKGTTEIHDQLEGEAPTKTTARSGASFVGVVAQIAALDAVFSLDSVIMAVGMANEFWVMASAIVAALAIMLAASKPLADFVERHPTVKILAISFLLLIGMALIADAAGFHVPKGYIYAAIGFSIGVEALNQIAARRRRLRAGRSSEPAARPGSQAPERSARWRAPR